MHDTDKDKQFEYPTIKDLYPLNKTVDVDKIRESLASKPNSFKPFSPEVSDVIELGIDMETNNRNTLLDA